MATPTELIERNLAARDGELLVGGVGISEIVARHGTPLFVYDGGQMQRRLQALRAAAPPRFEICYSIKANPAQAILRRFVAAGCGLEVASAGELCQALAAGCAPQRVLFAGPGKTAEELGYALDRGIGEVHVESFEEIGTLERLAGARGTRVGVAVRVNPGSVAEGGAMRMGGKPSVFGFDEEMLEQVLDRVLACAALDLRGVHFYVGTQILDHRVLLRQYEACLVVARRAAQHAARALATVDFGGGLGIPYYANERPLDLERLGAGLHELQLEGPEFSGTRFLLEPGRFLVGESGVYAARVTAVKRSRGKTFVVTDGGMHHHLAASGNLGQVIKRNFPVAVLNRLDAPNEIVADVVGPLCTPLDVLARDAALPEVTAGDLIGVLQSGAYARAASPLNFLSHPGPPEVEVVDGVERLIRRRGRYEDSLGDQLAG